MKNPKIKLILSIMALVAAIFVISGCSGCQSSTDSNGVKNTTLTPKAKQVIANAEKVAGSAAIQLLTQEADNLINGKQITSRDAAQQAANDLWQNVDQINNHNDVSSVVMAAGAGALANVTATAFKKSTADPSSTANAFAAVISTIAGAPPHPSTVN